MQQQPQGLLAQQQQPQQPQQPQQQEQGGGAQKMYDYLVGRLLKALYANPQAITDTLGRADPAQGASLVMANLLTTIHGEAQTNGKQIPPPIMFRAGMELTQALGEMVVEAGIVPAEQEGALMEAAYFDALARFGQSANLTDQERQAYLAEIDQLEAAQGQPQQPQQPQPGGNA